MLKLTEKSLENTAEWASTGTKLPRFDIAAMKKKTYDNPTWIHFGAGNIFRGFIAELAQELLNNGDLQTGIIATDTFDFEIIEKIYHPHDNLGLLVLMNPDGTLDKEVIASVAESLPADSSNAAAWSRMCEIFKCPSLQMASFTITEKGYSLRNVKGEIMPVVTADMQNGPTAPKHAMAAVAALAFVRFQAGELPIAFVSMDNCSENGLKLQSAVLEVAAAWLENGFVPKAFIDYLNDASKVTFPWSMIDKITPRPSDYVKESLEKLGIGEMDPVITSRNTYIAPFINAEAPRYLIVEDAFPNGHPPLDKTRGMFFTTRETVKNTERMKVTTCLNPLHTALAVYGCMLGFDSIAAEMKDDDLRTMVMKIGYVEGMPVVVNPGIIDPKQFIDEVIGVRLPNPFIPDTPQRIAVDTSQKLAIRFGETIKSYGDKAASLTFIPLVLAGWCRYALGIDDNGNAFEPSPDPMLATVKASLAGIDPKTGAYAGQLRDVLKNKVLFGVDLFEVSLGDKVEAMFCELIAGPGAVRATLRKYTK
ncbi:MAG: mannitol dehydrogenase family protein [Clostridia bacterium]